MTLLVGFEVSYGLRGIAGVCYVQSIILTGSACGISVVSVIICVTTKRSYLEAAGIGNIKTVGNNLKALEDAGFLKSEMIGKEKLYLNYKLMEILRKVQP